MRHTGISGQEIGIENLSGVRAGEVAGLGDGVEDLAEGGGVDGKVIDGFVLNGGDVGMVVGEGEHGVDGAGVGGCEAFPLLRNHAVSDF